MSPLRIALALLLSLLGAAPAAAERVALVVGVGAYRHVPALPNATNDATDMATALRGLGFPVDLVLDPDRPALETAVERFGVAARGAEAALFFYAGRALEVGGRNWLIPVSAELRSPQQLRFQALELDAVAEQTQGAARVGLIILDACRDNPFRMLWPAASRSAAGQGLARVTTATGTLVVYSTAPGAVAADGRGRNSPFTAALLRHLPTPVIEVRPMLAEVRRSVREATGGAQIPWEESSLEGSFYFRPAAAPVAGPPAAPAVAPPAAAAPSSDALAWQFVLNSRNPADFDTFLRQFPDSVFTPFARNRLAELQGTPERLAAMPGGRPAGPTRGPEAPVPFRCPPPGLWIAYGDGPVRQFLGAAADDPDICLSGNSASPVRQLFNFYTLPAADEAALRVGLRALWPASPGRETSMILTVNAAGGGATRFRDTFRVLRRETIAVGAESRETLVIERRQEGVGGNSHRSVQTFWWDIESGAWLRREIEVLRGTTTATPYRASRIEQR